MGIFHQITQQHPQQRRVALNSRIVLTVRQQECLFALFQHRAQLIVRRQDHIFQQSDMLIISR